jgi:L-ascorbate metabolism protein UlaG (beta-lactamase superfamily)
MEQLKNVRVAETKGVVPGETLIVQGVPIETTAAYNTNKHFHPKADEKVGFIITLNKMRIYHTGDTDDIPEMNATEPEVALVPVSGTYVMTAEEAAKAVNEKIKPKKLAIPMHYGSIVGTQKDAVKFKQLVTACPVQILDKD